MDAKWNFEYDTDSLYLQDANGLGTSIMHDWPSIRVRETLVYASSLHSWLSVMNN